MSIWDLKSNLDSLGGGKEERKRSTRVGEAIRNELLMLLLQRVRDPKLAHVTVSRVVVSDDLKYAKIYYTVEGGTKAVKLAQNGLERAKGFMRSHIAKTLNMRYTPALQFFFDETAEKVEEVEEILRQIAEEREEKDDS